MTKPSDLIRARVKAFHHCDFGFIFDSYHPSSNFRRQFTDRDEYIRYGWANLGKEFRISGCLVIREEIDGNSARVIFRMDFELHGERQCFAELAWLEADGEGWRYLYGQKLTAEEWPVPVSQLDFHHFDTAIDKVRY